MSNPSSATAASAFVCSNPDCGIHAPSGVAFKRCARCKTTYYCTPACQTAHWAVHKKTCRELEWHSRQVTPNECQVITMGNQALTVTGWSAAQLQEMLESAGAPAEARVLTRAEKAGIREASDPCPLDVDRLKGRLRYFGESNAQQRPDGEGVAWDEDENRIYKGTWRDGVASGTGVEYRPGPGGWYFSGQFVNGVGQGTRVKPAEMTLEMRASVCGPEAYANASYYDKGGQSVFGNAPRAGKKHEE